MKFTIYDFGRKEYLFNKKKFTTRAEAKEAIIKDFMLGDERKYFTLEDLMREGKLEFHFENGKIFRYEENDEKKITRFFAKVFLVIAIISFFLMVFAPAPTYVGMLCAVTIISILANCHLNTLSNEK